MAKLCPKIILEGTRLTSKTEIAFALNEHPRIVGPRKYKYHSPLISAEWCAFTNFPWGRGLINFNSDEESLAMETYATWIKLFELQRYYSWIVDRFHISTKVFQKQNNGREYDFYWLEERLRNLNFRLVLLYRNPESFQKAKEERLKVSGNPSQYDNLHPIIADQNVFRFYFDNSILEKKAIDISNLSNIQTADAIADWLEQSGGLYTY